MAKRFIDTQLDDRAWFRKLPPRLKCAYQFLCRQCDTIGIWNIDMESLSFHVGEDVDLEEMLLSFGDRIEVIEEDKLFLPAFASFQYGDESGRLSPKNKFHLSVAAKLQARGITPPEFKPVEATSDPKGMGVDTHPTGGGTPQGKGLGQGLGKGQGGKGGAGENPEIVPADVARCKATWKETLLRFEIDRNLSPAEELEIVRAIQRNGADFVELALYGARYEKAVEGFKPAEHVAIARILLPDREGRLRIDKFANLGAAARKRLAAQKAKPGAATTPAAGETERELPAEEIRAILAEAGFGGPRRLKSAGGGS
jgi:hypothetical protein